MEIFHDLGWFFTTRIRIRFIEADPDLAYQNETVPDPQHWENIFMIYPYYQEEEISATEKLHKAEQALANLRRNVKWQILFGRKIK